LIKAGISKFCVLSYYCSTKQPIRLDNLSAIMHKENGREQGIPGNNNRSAPSPKGGK
jgi:hypothetical protein